MFIHKYLFIKQTKYITIWIITVMEKKIQNTKNSLL